MKFFRLWLGLGALVWFVVVLPAAPAPAPESQGPISDALRLREKLPKTAPPQKINVHVSDDSLLMQAQRIVYTPYAVEKTVQDGETVKKIVVTQYQQVSVSYVATAPLKNCKFYAVTKEGKLEAIETEKAAAHLKKPTTILIGDQAELDPRHLEIVKPGTLYLVKPAPQPQPQPLPEAPPLPKNP
jgi:hypothetical protein